MIQIRSKKQVKKPLLHKIILATLSLAVIASLLIAFMLYRYVYAPNVDLGDKESTSLYIPSGASYEMVLDSLQPVIVNRRSFEWLATRKQYPELVKPGRYIIPDRMNNLEIINLLRSGDQVPVRVTFHSIRTTGELAKTISAQIEADSSRLDSLLNDEGFLRKFGLDEFTVLTLFIPNTYEFYWNTGARQFIERMNIESGRFWTEERQNKARDAGLSTQQVITLASIVDKETNKNDEKARIAGVYMNRLKRGWPLQADPTVVYATGDFDTRRVLKKHTRIDSPYNTYKYKGLPPGPICIPEISSIDAVLDHEKHDYMYFVASDELNGYHAFSKTLREHNSKARKYRKAVKLARNNS